VPASIGNRTTRSVCIAVVLVFAGATAGCGGSASGPAVVRIGHSRIDADTIRHWEHAIGLGVDVASASKPPRESPHVQAVTFLINGNRVLEEARRKGLTIPSSAVKRSVEQRLDDLSKGDAKKTLASTGRTIADVEFEARTALAASRLRETLFKRVPAPTEAEIASYYRQQHMTLYPEETRSADLIEGAPSRSAAIALAKRLDPGSQFAKLALHETVARASPVQEEQNFNGHLVHAIFTAPLEKIIGPVSYAGKWVIFVVRGVNRGPLGVPAITAEFTERLLSAHRQLALKAFIARYRREWRARTFCGAGYVVPGCSESHENSELEVDPLASK
jgi:hypothetical protein